MPKLYPPLKMITHAGVAPATPESAARAIILSNTIALIALLLSCFYFGYRVSDGWETSNSIILLAIVLIAAVPFLNYHGKTQAGGFLLSLIIPITSLIVAFAPRMRNPELYSATLSPGIYCVVLTTAIIPVLIFSTREKKLMITCLAINFLVFASMEILFRYYSELRELPSPGEYLSANISLLIAYMLLVGSVVSLKAITDRYELRNAQLITGMNRKNAELKKLNVELYDLNMNIEAQNEEIQAQSEELMISQESLSLANKEIERQNAELERRNELLAEKLDEKTRDLLLTNQHLIAQNNELQQFSYTVSHNLRGPVASMLGLLNIHRHAQTPDERQKILSLLEQSTQSLETVIRDLNKIIDIRSDKYAVFEQVSLERELDLVRQTLNSFISKTESKIECDFQVKEIFSVKAYINSIFYNLVSNAMQYRSLSRKPQISLSSAISDGFIHLKVSDNGLGINLTKHRGEIFKLYKRFHTHTQGKGLGLYLIKQKVEKLNGRIEVNSQCDEGTTFSIFLPSKDGLEKG